MMANRVHLDDGRHGWNSPEWGPWVLVAEQRLLVLRPGSLDRYAVGLDRCLTAAETLDWIMQVAGRYRQDPFIVAGLVNALNDVLAPQANLCSWGRASKITKARLEELLGEWR